MNIYRIIMNKEIILHIYAIQTIVFFSFRHYHRIPHPYIIDILTKKRAMNIVF